MQTSIVAPPLADEIKRMGERIAELEAALQPFASCLVYEKHGEQWFCRLELARVTQADFARAQNLLAKTTE